MTDHERIERFKETVDYLLDKSYSDFLARDHYETAADVLLMLERQELKAQREDEAASDMRDCCERYEPTYNPEDGSM